MGLQASDWETLREMIQNFLYQIPDEVSSKDSAFVRWTGLPQKTLEANWDAGGMLTSCNAFGPDSRWPSFTVHSAPSRRPRT